MYCRKKETKEIRKTEKKEGGKERKQERAIIAMKLLNNRVALR